MSTFTLNMMTKMMHNLFDRTNKQPENPAPKELQLSLSEIEVLLSILKDASFKIKDIEILYKTLIKLQEQHKLLSK